MDAAEIARLRRRVVDGGLLSTEANRILAALEQAQKERDRAEKLLMRVQKDAKDARALLREAGTFIGGRGIKSSDISTRIEAMLK